MNKYIKFLVVIIVAVNIFACKDEADIPSIPNIHTVTLDNHILNLSVEDEVVIKPSFNSVSTFQKEFKWESSVSDIVSFQVNPTTLECNIVALKLGQTTMRLVSNDGTVSDTCQIIIDKEPFVLKNPLLINFGSLVSGNIEWNYLTNYQQGSSLFDMLDSQKNNTPVDFQILKSFSWFENDDYIKESYLLPEEYGSILIPNVVTKSAFKGDTKDTEVYLELSALRTKQKYNIGFFSCKPTWDDVCSTKITIEGEDPQNCTILTKCAPGKNGETGASVLVGTALPGGTPAEQNTTIRVGMVKNISPDANGSIKIKISGGEGGNQPNGIFWLNCLWISPVESSLSTSKKFGL